MTSEIEGDLPVPATWKEQQAVGTNGSGAPEFKPCGSVVSPWLLIGALPVAIDLKSRAQEIEERIVEKRRGIATRQGHEGKIRVYSLFLLSQLSCSKSEGPLQTIHFRAGAQT